VKTYKKYYCQTIEEYDRISKSYLKTLEWIREQEKRGINVRITIIYPVPPPPKHVSLSGVPEQSIADPMAVFDHMFGSINGHI